MVLLGLPHSTEFNTPIRGEIYIQRARVTGRTCHTDCNHLCQNQTPQPSVNKSNVRDQQCENAWTCLKLKNTCIVTVIVSVTLHVITMYTIYLYSFLLDSFAYHVCYICTCAICTTRGGFPIHGGTTSTVTPRAPGPGSLTQEVEESPQATGETWSTPRFEKAKFPLRIRRIHGPPGLVKFVDRIVSKEIVCVL